MAQTSPAVSGPVQSSVRPLSERLRENLASWAPTSDETLEAHYLMEAAAIAAEEGAKDRELLMRLVREAATLTAQVEEWRRLTDPTVLHVSLLRGLPAQLTRQQFLHLAGDEPRKLLCGKCGADRFTQACPKGFGAALNGECSIAGAAA